MLHVVSIKKSIEMDVKKMFPCEAMSDWVYTQITKALDEGKMPVFDDVHCECNFGADKEKSCQFDGTVIDSILLFNGITEKCREYLQSTNDTGEWR